MDKNTTKKNKDSVINETYLTLKRREQIEFIKDKLQGITGISNLRGILEEELMEARRALDIAEQHAKDVSEGCATEQAEPESLKGVRPITPRGPTKETDAVAAAPSLPEQFMGQLEGISKNAEEMKKVADDAMKEIRRDVQRMAEPSMRQGNQPISELLREGLTKLQARVHGNMREAGFWEGERNEGELLALMHSEISEAFLAFRQKEDKASEHIPRFTEIEEELADLFIRIMDYSGSDPSRNVVNEFINLFSIGASYGRWAGAITDKVHPKTRLSQLLAFVGGEIAPGDPGDYGMEDDLLYMHGYISSALETLRHGGDAKEGLAECLAQIIRCSAEHDLRLGAAINAKIEFNLTRAKMHGKKF